MVDAWKAKKAEKDAKKEAAKAATATAPAAKDPALTDIDNVWEVMQNLSFGGENQNPQQISVDARRVRTDNNRLSLLALALNSAHQKHMDLKILLPKAWKMEGKITSRINNDGTVQFYFKYDHHLMNVLKHGLWHCNNWIVDVDRWTRRFEPDFLHQISFWVKVLNIPEDFCSDAIIHEVGDILDSIDEIRVTEASLDNDSEVWIHVQKNISDRLIFIRYIDFEPGQSTMICFIYKKLRKFCFRCGALMHSDSVYDYEGEVYYQQRIEESASDISMPLQQSPEAEIPHPAIGPSHPHRSVPQDYSVEALNDTSVHLITPLIPEGASDATQPANRFYHHDQGQRDDTMAETVDSNVHLEDNRRPHSSGAADFHFLAPQPPAVPGFPVHDDQNALRGVKHLLIRDYDKIFGKHCNAEHLCITSLHVWSLAI
ncbi:unnamed protein product [Thlaspi arvense]|uniref:DUF4283 domain-containing protein n=1 Tax=Thlaspi arvense TaxID=13288 RepID=A0AAU9SSN3_THLAR|nr:unnamed protein product [Thlaspi arvense]